MAFPGTLNISYYKGDTYEFKIYPKNSVGGVFDLFGQGYTVKFYIATSRGPSPTQSVECNSVINEDSSVSCEITPAQGNQLVAGTRYEYDVQVTKPGSPPKVYTLLTGTVSVTADISGAV